MGFICPYCRQDFGVNKEAFQKHLEENPKCHVEVWAYTDFAMQCLDKERGRKQQRVPKNSRSYNQVSPNHQWRKVNMVSNDDGSDTVVCKRCGLKAKRYYSSFKFDMRYIRKIENCID